MSDPHIEDETIPPDMQAFADLLARRIGTTQSDAAGMKSLVAGLENLALTETDRPNNFLAGFKACLLEMARGAIGFTSDFTRPELPEKERVAWVAREIGTLPTFGGDEDVVKAASAVFIDDLKWTMENLSPQRLQSSFGTYTYRELSTVIYGLPEEIRSGFFEELRKLYPKIIEPLSTDRVHWVIDKIGELVSVSDDEAFMKSAGRIYTDDLRLAMENLTSPTANAFKLSVPSHLAKAVHAFPETLQEIFLNQLEERYPQIVEPVGKELRKLQGRDGSRGNA